MIDFNDNEMDMDVARVKVELLQREYSYEQLLDIAAHYCVVFNAQVKLTSDCLDSMSRNTDTFKSLGDKQELLLNEGQEIMVDLIKENNNSLKEGFVAGIKTQRISHAKKGAMGRKNKYQPLKELAKKLVNAKNFKSRRNAAKTITPEILAESKKLGIFLSEQQAEITITGWLKEMGLPANI